MKKVKIFTFIMTILPIASIYKFYIPIISVADFLLLLLAIFTIFDNILLNKKNVNTVNIGKGNNHYEPLILMLSFIFITLVSMLIVGHYSFEEVFKRALRYSIFSFTVSIVGYYYFDFKYGVRLIFNISILATVYIIIQTITYYVLGIVLPFIIPFLNPVAEEYVNITPLISWYKQFYYRPQSFFTEPAHFSQYVLIGLTYCLYRKELLGEKNRIHTAIFLSIGLVLSTSSIGIIMCAFVWGMYFINYFKNKMTLKKLRLFYVLLFLLLILLPILWNIAIVNTAVLRVFQATARTTDSFSLFSNLNNQQRILGLGLGNEDYYIGFMETMPFMNSFTIVLLSVGYLGFILYSLFFLILLIRKKGMFRVFVLILLILSGVSEIFFAYIGILYLLCIYYGSDA